MALTYPGMLCSLCKKPIPDANVDTFCTTANFQLHTHLQFNVLNDVAVHQECIDSWKLRDAFVEFYNAEIRDELMVDEKGHVRYRGSWLAELWRTITARSS